MSHLPDTLELLPASWEQKQVTGLKALALEVSTLAGEFPKDSPQTQGGHLFAKLPAQRTFYDFGRESTCLRHSRRAGGTARRRLVCPEKAGPLLKEIQITWCCPLGNKKNSLK